MTSGSFERTQDFYTMGQFSKFVEVGAVRLETTSTTNGDVQAVAFRNQRSGGGEVVLVLVNRAPSDLVVNVELESGGGWTAEIEAASVTTLVFPSASS